jgi:hypothetical protein
MIENYTKEGEKIFIIECAEGKRIFTTENTESTEKGEGNRVTQGTRDTKVHKGFN